MADSRQVLARLDPELTARFVSKGVRYIRNLHAGRGIGLSWQDVFETDDQSWVETYCREGEIDFAWQQTGGWWTHQVRPALATHPVTGESVWFNQVDQWHPSNLDSQTARALLSLMSEDQLPIYTTYGDGTPFGDHEMEAIRTAFQEEIVTFPWQPGDVLAVDNMLTAHGRMPFVGRRKVLVMMGSPVHRSARGQEP